MPETASGLLAPLAFKLPTALQDALGAACLLLPAAVVAFIAVRRGRVLPAIVLLLPLSNAVWSVVLTPQRGLIIGIVSHGIQYLGIAMAFHVREGNGEGAVRRVLAFAAGSLLGGYVLFYLWPWAFVGLGFGATESFFVVAAVVNLHHFIVDGFIWKISSDGRNRRVLEDAAPLPQAA
jgi:hypothetical protein